MKLNECKDRWNRMNEGKMKIKMNEWVYSQMNVWALWNV